jgi:hypothetical protein
MATLPLTVDELKSALPDKVKKSVNQELIDRINTTLSDPEMYAQYRENLLGYAQVMKEGRFKTESYVAAVKYVSYKLQGKTNISAYSLTFPEKIADFAARNVASKDIASYCTAYHKSKLVMLLMEQTMVPVWVLNQDLFQSALNVQAELMMTANSEKVRTDAASSLLTHLKPPEAQKIELDIGSTENNTIAALREATMRFVTEQQNMLKNGSINAEELAKKPLLLEGSSEVVS